MMAGLLFARAGCRVRVLEKHADFFRDFRGDTVHPSTMEILAQLGMLERFLARPHDRLTSAHIRVAGRDFTMGDLSHLRTPAPFIAMMPQWDFLAFIRDEAAAFRGFALEMRAEVTGFSDDSSRITGVALADGRSLTARLVIAADGRSSIARAMLPLKTLGAPMDVFWFRIGKPDRDEGVLRSSIDSGRMIVLIDRRTYWQVAFTVPKGQSDAILAKGLDWITLQVTTAFPDIEFAAKPLQSLDDLHLLTVALDRLTRWYRPGLLAIGDAAHAMSPIGGIGVNLAVQDAVAAANILAEGLATGRPVDSLLHRVQHKRLWPVRVVQLGQGIVQDRVIGRLIEGSAPAKAPLALRLVSRFSWLQRIAGRFLGLGFGRESVRSLSVAPALTEASKR